MALQLSNYKFFVTNWTFNYPQNADDKYKETHDPEKVSLKGFCIDSTGKKLSCYVKDEFKNFGLTMDEFLNKLLSDCVISGQGLCKLDWQYNYKLEMLSYSFNEYYYIKVITKPADEKDK